jgi:hypothetical protein
MFITATAQLRASELQRAEPAFDRGVCDGFCGVRIGQPNDEDGTG